MRKRLWLSLAVLSLLGSCGIGRMETNGPIDAAAVASLHPGTTTAREVVERLGAPMEVVQLGRRSAYRYDATAAKSAGLVLFVFNMFAQDERTDRVWVFFDEKDILTHYGATFAVHQTQYALPWEDVHEPEDNFRRDQARPGLSGK